jgi:hypothetical protein
MPTEVSMQADRPDEELQPGDAQGGILALQNRLVRRLE